MATLCLTPTQATDLCTTPALRSYPTGTAGTPVAMTSHNDEDYLTTPTSMPESPWSGYPTMEEIEEFLIHMEMKEFLETMQLQTQRCKMTKILRVNEPGRG